MSTSKPKSHNTKQIDDFHKWLKRTGYILTSLTLVVGAAAILIARVATNVAPQPATQAAPIPDTKPYTITPATPTSTVNSDRIVTGTVKITPVVTVLSAQLVDPQTDKVLATGTTDVVLDSTKLANGAQVLKLIFVTQAGISTVLTINITVVN